MGVSLIFLGVRQQNGCFDTHTFIQFSTYEPKCNVLTGGAAVPSTKRSGSSQQNVLGAAADPAVTPDRPLRGARQWRAQLGTLTRAQPVSRVEEANISSSHETNSSQTAIQTFDTPPPEYSRYLKNEQRYRRETWQAFPYNNLTSSVEFFLKSVGNF